MLERVISLQTVPWAFSDRRAGNRKISMLPNLNQAGTACESAGEKSGGLHTSRPPRVIEMQFARPFQYP